MTPETFERNWPLSDVTLGPVLQEFDGRVVGILDSKQGRFVYKRFPADGAHDRERSTLIFDFLEGRSFVHAPRLLHTVGGARTLATDDTTAIAMEYVAGTVPAPTVASYAQIGEILGELHSLADYPVECPITLAAIRPGFGSIARRLGAAADRERFVELADSLTDIDTLPRALIHFEMSLGNTVQRPDGTIVALDWDQAGIGARVLDPGYFLISAFVSEDLAFDEPGARAFYRAYRSRVTLSAAEVEAVFDASVFHALRYVVWGDVERRWRRIQWAVDHEDELMSAVYG